MIYLLVFVLYFITDWCSSRWAAACVENRAAHAGYWMAIYHFLHAIGVLCIVHDPWCCVSLAFGGMCGTRFSINQKVRTFEKRYGPQCQPPDPRPTLRQSPHWP